MLARPSALGAWWGLPIWLALSALAGGIASAVTVPQIPGWYAGLVKPSFTPPDWVFGPVWTALYVMMALAVWLVCRVPLSAGGAARGMAVALYLVQLALNCLWSILFFKLHQIEAAAIDITLLLVAVAATALAFYPLHRLSGWLLMPYLIWVGYAGGLSWSIWATNP